MYLLGCIVACSTYLLHWHNTNLIRKRDANRYNKKLRCFHPLCQEVIKEDVDKLMEVEFIREIQYPKWLANFVVVLKKMASGVSVLTTPTSMIPT